MNFGEGFKLPESTFSKRFKIVVSLLAIVFLLCPFAMPASATHYANSVNSIYYIPAINYFDNTVYSEPLTGSWISPATGYYYMGNPFYAVSTDPYVNRQGQSFYYTYDEPDKSAANFSLFRGGFSAFQREVVVLSVPSFLQQAYNTCAPTSAKMILAYKGIASDEFVLSAEMGTYGDFGTHQSDLVRVMNLYLHGYEYPSSGQNGYFLEPVSSADLSSEQYRLFEERIVRNLSAGHPLIFTIDTTEIVGYKCEHSIVGVGYKLNDLTSQLEYVYYLDPSFAGLHVIDIQTLYYKILPCIEPVYAWYASGF